jgi:hypothetical protein
MAEIRIQIAHHFKIDPAQLVPGLIRLPEQITRTVSVGDEFSTEKVSLGSLPDADRIALIAEIEKQTREATRTAQPAGKASASSLTSGDVKEELSAF